MHPSPVFTVTDQDQALAFARAYPFAVLTAWDGAGLRTVQAPLIPVLDAAGGLIGFEGHLARANLLTRALAGLPEAPAVAVFCGPDAYVSPNSYPSKAEHGRTVPTWNYVTVEAEGRIRLIEEADETRAVIERQSALFERGQARAWRMSDAPADYIERLMRAIVGFRLEVTRFEATEKLSQDKADKDFLGVVAALEARGEPGAAETAARMKMLEKG